MFNENGIHTPNFIYTKNSNEYSVNIVDKGLKYFIWAEEYMPQSILDDVFENGYEEIDLNFLNEIGALVGKMCEISKERKIHFGWNSPFILFDKPFPEDEYDENYSNALRFYNGLKDNKKIDNKLFINIWEAYNTKRNKLKKIYSLLPKGALQCDLSSNNILLGKDKNLLGLIDYNLSGDDSYVAYAIQEFIFIAFEAYRIEWLDRKHCNYMEERFRALYKGFIQEYSQLPIEEDAIKLLYNICRPFRWDKVTITLRKAELGLFAEVNDRMSWMYSELNRSDILELLKR